RLLAPCPARGGPRAGEMWSGWRCTKGAVLLPQDNISGCCPKGAVLFLQDDTYVGTCTYLPWNRFQPPVRRRHHGAGSNEWALQVVAHPRARHGEAPYEVAMQNELTPLPFEPIEP